MKSAIIVIGISVLVAVVGIWLYFFQPQTQEVHIEFLKPGQVPLGQPFVMSVSFSNDTDKVLTNARVSLIVPEGISFLGKSPNQRVLEHSIGDFGPGSLNKRDFDLITSSGSQTVKRVEAKVIYGTNGRAQFEVRSGTEIAVGEPAVTLSFEAPEKVFSGEHFNITVNYANNSTQEVKNVRLKIDYPPVFQFQRSSLPTAKANNQWDLGSLPKNASGSIVISGTIFGQEGTFFNLEGMLTADFLGQTYVLTDQAASLSLSTSPLSLRIEANGREDYVARLGDNITYVLRYKNNSAVVLENVTIKAVLSGELFDFLKARSDGFFDSLTNTFVWSAANTPKLAAVPPQGDGTVNLQIKLKDSFPIRRVSDKNFTLKVRGQIESPTVPSGVAASRTLSVANLETKVAGRLEIQAKGFFRDTAAGILNSGPYPPMVNQATQYTIHWIIRNHATDVSNVRVSAFLQSNTRFTGQVKSTIDTQPIYEPSSGEIVWQIPNLTATKGVLGQPIEAVFQVENTPAVNQIGKRVILFGETRVQGEDNFVGLPLSDTSEAVTTELPDDPTVPGNSGYVQQ